MEVLDWDAVEASPQSKQALPKDSFADLNISAENADVVSVLEWDQLDTELETEISEKTTPPTEAKWSFDLDDPLLNNAVSEALADEPVFSSLDLPELESVVESESKSVVIEPESDAVISVPPPPEPIEAVSAEAAIVESESDSVISVSPPPEPIEVVSAEAASPEQIETVSVQKQPEALADGDVISNATLPLVPETERVPKAIVEKTSDSAGDKPASTDTINPAIWEMFSEELAEQLQSMDGFIQTLQSNTVDANSWLSLKRSLHTVKGGARMAGMMAMGNIAHEAEDMLDKLDVSKQSPEALHSILKRVQKHVDSISLMAEQHALPVYSPVIPEEVLSGKDQDKTQKDQSDKDFIKFVREDNESLPGSFLERLLLEQADQLPDISILANGKVSAAQSITPEDQTDNAFAGQAQEHIRLPAVFLDRMIEKAASLNVQQSGIAERLQSMTDDIREFGRTANRLRQLLRSLELETEAQIHAGHHLTASAKRGDFDPLEMDEYSELQRLSRALSESINDLVNIEADLSQHLRNTGTILNETQSGSRNLYQELLVTRLIEVSAIVPRLRRVVRQAVVDIDREVSLEIIGEDLKLDRHLLQKMTAPVEHLLRNAVSHGIETVAERIKLGKPAEGHVYFNISREDGEIVIRVSDDGRGLDTNKLRHKAIELGLIRSSDVLSEQDIHRLILRSGFTTATSLSQVAGRGVGMDVVNSEVKAMGGVLQIRSKLGKGTSFILRLPLAMTANPVLFVSVQSQFYALQLGNIQGLMRLSTEDIQEYLGQEDKRLRFNDIAFPLHYLGAVLEPGLQLQLQPEHMYPIVFVRTGDQSIAWLVDAISGRREVLLQSLGALFKACRFYSAATITTDGQVVLVPDMVELATRVGESTKTAVAEAQVDEPTQHHRPQHDRMHVLVVDDSITVRKVTEKLLLGENYEVGTARDGMDALQKLDEFEPDLILSDIEMPRMDGFDLLSAVRQSELWHQVPVIMISSRTASKHRERATELGASDFLGKPYQNHELLTLIQQYLDASLEQDEAEVIR